MCDTRNCVIDNIVLTGLSVSQTKQMLKPPRIDCSNAPAAQQVLNSLVVDATLVNQKDQRKDKKTLP